MKDSNSGCLRFGNFSRHKSAYNPMETTKLHTQGEMAEWSIAAVLKTVEGHTSGGSNPSLSAKKAAFGLLFLCH